MPMQALTAAESDFHCPPDGECKVLVISVVILRSGDNGSLTGALSPLTPSTSAVGHIGGDNGNSEAVPQAVLEAVAAMRGQTAHKKKELTVLVSSFFISIWG